jgi:hypothetical protein
MTMYSGNFINKLVDVVCQNCGRYSLDHSHNGDLCPSPSSSGPLFLDINFL